MADTSQEQFPFEVVGDSPMARAVQKAAHKHNEKGNDPASHVNGMPPNFGFSPLPHISTFSGIASSASKTYRPSDEALKDSLQNARYMRNDPVIMECVEQRQRSVALLDWHLEADDDKDSEQKSLVDELTTMLKKMPRFMQYRENLLHAIWYGRYGIQHRWRWKKVRGKMRCVVDQWLPIHGDKLTFKYDEETGDFNPDKVGIRVGAGYTMGTSISNRWTVEKTTQVEPTSEGLAYFIEPWERSLLALHKHYIEDGEYEEPTNAGRIFGVGVRSRIYWCWYQKQEALAFLMEFLERSATGMEIWYYPWGSKEARDQTRAAAEERIGSGGNIVLVPRPLDGGDAYGVERIEPSMSGADSLERIITGYFGHLIKRYILGQTLTSEAEPTGFGSGLAEVHLDTYMQIVQYDATNLEETMTTDLLEPLIRYNFPKYADLPITFRIDTEAPDVDGKLAAWERAFGMGLELKAQDVMDLIGASKPSVSDKTLKNPAMEPQAGGMGGMEQMMGGMPMPPQQPEAGPTPEEQEAEKQEDINDLTRSLSQSGMLDIKGEDSEREKVKFGAEKYAIRCGQESKPEVCPRDEGGKFSTTNAQGGESKPTTIRLSGFEGEASLDDDTEEKGEYDERGFYKPTQAEIDRDMDTLKAQNIEGNVFQVDDSLNWERGNMPQITEESIPGFIEKLRGRGIGSEVKKIAAGELSGTQKEINGAQAAGMAQFIRDGNELKASEPVLASSDGYILDGHHRWAATRIAKPEAPMDVMQVDMPIKELLHEAREYEKVGFKGAKKEHQGPEGGSVKTPVPTQSRAEVVGDYDPSDPEQASLMKELGLPKDPVGAGREVANLVGAPDDGHVSYYVDTDRGYIKAEITGEGYSAVRHINVAPVGTVNEGEKTIYNKSLYVARDRQGHGIGSSMLGKQIHFAKQHGFTKIGCLASGRSPAIQRANNYSSRNTDVGYKVWPKFGYDAPFNDAQQNHIQAQGICCPTTVQELHSMYGGRDWWSENGWGFEGTLDLSAGSRSMQVWDRFSRRQRAMGRIKKTYQKPQDGDQLGESMTSQDERSTQGEVPDFTDEELGLLDSIWDEMIQEEQGPKPEPEKKESFARLPSTVEGVLRYAKSAEDFGSLALRGVDPEVIGRATERYHAAGWLRKLGVDKEAWELTSVDLDYLERAQPWND